MSIGSYLLNPDNLALVQKKSWKFGRPLIVEQGMRYYDAHPDEVERITANLAYMGLPHDGAALDEVLRQQAVHYFEKLFILVKGFEAYWIAQNRIDMGDSLLAFTQAKEEGRAVFMAQSHFGATYFMAIALMAQGIDVKMVGRFPDPAGSMMIENGRQITEKFGCGSMSLINIADPKVDVPLEMFMALMGKKVLSNVFDECNALCQPVRLLGRTIMGGSGMDKVLARFDDSKIALLTPFVIRVSEDSFRFEVERHRLDSPHMLQDLFDALEKRVSAHYEQWYFIHELHDNFISDDG